MPQQFDVFRTPGGTLVVVIQSDLLEAMPTRVVAPLLPAGAAGRPMRGLTPEIVLGAEIVVLMPQLLATLATGELGRLVGTIRHERDVITRAVNMLLGGV